MIDLILSIGNYRAHRGSIRFKGIDYHSDGLHGLRHPVTIKYDPGNTSKIYIHDSTGKYICTANRVNLQPIRPMTGGCRCL
ncbi:MAG: Mu transposase C-terminal domain-containing protein [Deltaproteobacteria bacterium]|nr:Mu transposase C-terminal domain-containing protein [Deltaproteobacteria bacterium]